VALYVKNVSQCLALIIIIIIIIIIIFILLQVVRYDLMVLEESMNYKYFENKKMKV